MNIFENFTSSSVYADIQINLKLEKARLRFQFLKPVMFLYTNSLHLLYFWYLCLKGALRRA